MNSGPYLLAIGGLTDFCHLGMIPWLLKGLLLLLSGLLGLFLAWWLYYRSARKEEVRSTLEKARLTERLKGMRGRSEALESQLGALEERNELQVRLGSMEGEYQGIVSDREAQLSELRASLREKESDHQKVNLELNALKTNLNSAQTQAEQRAAEAKKLEASVGTLKADLATREKDLGAAKEKLRLVDKTANDREAELAAIKKDLEKRDAELATQKKEQAEWRAQLQKDKEESEKGWQGTLADLQANLVNQKNESKNLSLKLDQDTGLYKERLEKVNTIMAEKDKVLEKLRHDLKGRTDNE
ncbi:MAG: hypothetical protein AAF514_18850, partial [Verrucomicrobiota bacterium]